MDIDYIMTIDRIQKQMDFLENNIERMVCGCQILDNKTKNQISQMSNKTTLCFRKIQDIYNNDTDSIHYLPEKLIVLL